MAVNERRAGLTADAEQSVAAKRLPRDPEQLSQRVAASLVEADDAGRDRRAGFLVEHSSLSSGQTGYNCPHPAATTMRLSKYHGLPELA